MVANEITQYNENPNGKALAVVPEKSFSAGRSIFSLTSEEFERMQTLSKMVASSALSYAKNGKSTLSSGDVFLIMVKGIEIGLEPMAAIDLIDIIQGKPALKPQGMLALAYQSGKLADISITDDGSCCTVTVQRKDIPTSYTATFSAEDAGRFMTKEWQNGQSRDIPLSEKHNWKSQPAVMRKWRAVSAALRAAMPDVIQGLYSPEELDPNITVDGDGAIISLPEPQQKPPAPARLKPVSKPEAKTEPETTAETTESEPVTLPEWVTAVDAKGVSNVEKLVKMLTAKFEITDKELATLAGIANVKDTSLAGWGQYPSGSAAGTAVEAALNAQLDKKPETEEKLNRWTDFDIHAIEDICKDYNLFDIPAALNLLKVDKWQDFDNPQVARDVLKEMAVQMSTRLKVSNVTYQGQYTDLHSGDLVVRAYGRKHFRDIEGSQIAEDCEKWEKGETYSYTKGTLCSQIAIAQGGWEEKTSDKTGEVYFVVTGAGVELADIPF